MYLHLTLSISIAIILVARVKILPTGMAWAVLNMRCDTIVHAILSCYQLLASGD